MLKKIIPVSIGLTAIMIVGIISLLPADVADKNPGLLPPPTSVYGITGLDEINASTPNPIETRDLGPLDKVTSSAEPNRVFSKYQDIATKIGVPEMNLKILSNEDNSKIAILLSPSEITEETTNYQLLYKDEGMWITLYSLEDESLPLDYFTSQPNPGFRVVNVNDQYQAAIQSAGQVEQFGEVVDRRLSLDMITDEYQVSIRGFISDEQAIKAADYLTR